MPTQEELKILKDPEVFSWMIFDEGKSRVLLDTKISLVRLDDEGSSLKRCERWTGNLNLGGMSSFGWWISTLESQEDGLFEDCNDDLERFPNVVLVYSNLDEVRCVRLESWKEYFEGKSHSSEIFPKTFEWWRVWETLFSFNWSFPFNEWIFWRIEVRAQRQRFRRRVNAI